ASSRPGTPRQWPRTASRALASAPTTKPRPGAARASPPSAATRVRPSSPARAWNMIANHDDSVIPGYRSLAEAVHRHGCRVMSQLTHMGRRSQSDVESWHVLLAPSQIPEKVHREVPHEIEPE